ncbi:MAG TPA: right-handed parallel beta-helix repeat-containing protein [Polyangiaceae bacterium]
MSRFGLSSGVLLVFAFACGSEPSSDPAGAEGGEGGTAGTAGRGSAGKAQGGTAGTSGNGAGSAGTPSSGGSSGAEDAAGSGGDAGAQNGDGGASAEGGSGGSSGTAGGAGTGGGSFEGDCADESTRCVAPEGNERSEYTTIQAAVDAAAPGDRVFVFAGRYAGFVVEAGGTEGSPLVIAAAEAGAIIDSDGPTGDGVRLENVSDVTIARFTIEGSTERCIAARGATPEAPMARLRILDNTCRGAGHEGFYLSEASYSLVEGNSVSESGQNGEPRGHGIYLANAGSDHTVLRRNHIFDLPAEESAGIHMNGDLSVGGDGIIEGLVLDGNVLHGLVHNALNMDGVRRSTLVNNVIYDVAAHAMRGYAIDAAGGPSELVIANNTVDLASSGRGGVKLTEDDGGHVIFNNVLLTENDEEASVSVESADLRSGYNAVVDRFSVDGEELVGLAAAQALGLEEESFLATPALFRARGDDYRLVPGAPAAAAGAAELADEAAPEADAEGRARPQGEGFDVGAYESE